MDSSNDFLREVCSSNLCLLSSPGDAGVLAYVLRLCVVWHIVTPDMTLIHPTTFQVFDAATCDPAQLLAIKANRIKRVSVHLALSRTGARSTRPTIPVHVASRDSIYFSKCVLITFKIWSACLQLTLRALIILPMGEIYQSLRKRKHVQSGFFFLSPPWVKDLDSVNTWADKTWLEALDLSHGVK